jgi:SWI/SNF-related matrix-associated actin-dependent regulator of chromatin subfamily A-like protein 1
MTQLKLPAYDLVYMEETAAVRAALKAERMLDIDPENLEGIDMTALGSIATVRRIMGEAMAPMVSDYVDMVLEGGEPKLLLFGHHHSVLDYWEKHLRKWGVTRIDGTLDGAKKQRLVDDWIKDPRKQLMIGNTISMGTGTDGLQSVCTHCVFGEPDWVHGTNQQGVDRLDRGGQEGSVQADFCLVSGSFAEKVLGGALRKGQTVHKALDATVFLEDA